MNRPWSAERRVLPALARLLIESQFETFAPPVQLSHFGEGWDNVAYLVNDQYVFRFPRRQIAADLIETEASVLPMIAPRLPLPIPMPQFVGHATADYPWPFSGYHLLPGSTACRAKLTEGARHRAAQSLARFLAALHGTPVSEAASTGIKPDELGRLDMSRRIPQARESLEKVRDWGLLEDTRALDEIIDNAAGLRPARSGTLVHGDLYVRHVLVDESQNVSGIIDWGDVHIGDPAVDLAVAYCMLPLAARKTFRTAYGGIDDATWQLARFRALQHSLIVTCYGHETGEADLLREGKYCLANLLE